MAARVVSDYKDTNFWKQFTTTTTASSPRPRCFRLQRYKLLKAIHNARTPSKTPLSRCFRLQRYKLLKAIHNWVDPAKIEKKVVSDYKDTNFWKQFTTISPGAPSAPWLFQTTKIQTFESNSQLPLRHFNFNCCCFRLQRYKLLKAIHNALEASFQRTSVVSDYKDTNFWKQFTTVFVSVNISLSLFQTTKIQTFESNSQRKHCLSYPSRRCFRLQRYKLLKAIHNHHPACRLQQYVVSDYKDTNFWKQFTT